MILQKYDFSYNKIVEWPFLFRILFVPMKRLFFIILLFAVGSLLSSGCKKFEGEVTVPAYLQLDRIVVEEQPSGAPAPNEPGWYTYDINAAQLIAYFDGDAEETNLGTFELPCKIPVLHEGPIRYLTVVPVVKQNGISATRIQYPFFQTKDYEGLVLNPDKVTHVGRADVISTADGNDTLWTVPVNYYGTSIIGEKFYENFELPKTDIGFDVAKVQWIANDEAGARSGKGYGKISTPAGTTTVDFEINPQIVMGNNGFLYLEMDYKTDVQLRVGMRSALSDGDIEHTYWAIMLYPTHDWTKIYINMGKLWSQFNYYRKFHVVFSTVDMEGHGGETCLDNVKLITMY